MKMIQEVIMMFTNYFKKPSAPAFIPVTEHTICQGCHNLNSECECDDDEVYYT